MTLEENTQSMLVLRRESSFAGAAADWFLFMDNNQIGKIKNGERIAYRITPGRYRFFIGTPDSTGGMLSNVLEVEFGGGATIGLVCGLNVQGLTGNIPFLRPESAQGQARIRDAFSELIHPSEIRTCPSCTRGIAGVQARKEDFGMDFEALANPAGYVCASCNRPICATCAKQRMKKSTWSGYEKQPCPYCGKPFGEKLFLLEMGSRGAIKALCKAIQGGANIDWNTFIYAIGKSNYAEAIADAQMAQTLIAWAQQDQQIQKLAFPDPTGFLCPDCGAPFPWKAQSCPTCKKGRVAESGRGLLDFVPIIGTATQIATAVNEHRQFGSLADYMHKVIGALFPSKQGQKFGLLVPALAWMLFPPLLLSYFNMMIQQPGKINQKIVYREIHGNLMRIFTAQ